MCAMKITAGLGRLEDFSRLAQAGADEVFAGFLPLQWLEKYGNDVPVNRREVLLQDIQLDSFADMRILARMKADLGVGVALTFNAPCYPPSAHPILAEMISELLHIGFDDFIIADPGLLVYLHSCNIRANFHISGEAGVYNPDSVRFFESLGASRIIFPRKISPARMAECISAAPKLQYEAFVLNEMCHYSGAYCSSLHCDVLEPMCRVPYRCSGPDIRINPPDRDLSAFGSGGCGICALAELENAGITHLKIVGRGGHIDLIERDVRILRLALSSPDHAPHSLKSLLFPGDCSHNCYYKK